MDDAVGMSMADLAKADVENVLARLGNTALASTVPDLISAAGTELRVPGLYSWWVDEVGASELVSGLGQDCVIQPGLIYVGLAGASHVGGVASSNTLWRRITRMHLGHRQRASTLRRSLGAILAVRSEQGSIDETQLTAWMSAHLRVVTVPVPEVQTLKDLESVVLVELDPPLNLAKVPPTKVRKRLRELRKQSFQRNAPVPPSTGPPGRGI
ncbi:GIY-YIG nuclease family protein [Enemella evansiae]|uniref:GIY-YIG nuclease family protein n=1 Tax=Enemella evansiae TaxID=2016499 RepID=UPI00113FE81D|nr:hypothetical protein [Enemella evansiae]